ncbi:unnamed protein product [Arabidopsis halleri]
MESWKMMKRRGIWPLGGAEKIRKRRNGEFHWRDRKAKRDLRMRQEHKFINYMCLIYA